MIIIALSNGGQMLKAYGFTEFKNKVNDYSEIICYGAGKRIFRLEEFFDDSVLAKITIVVDKDVEKKNQGIVINKHICHVISLEDIETINENAAILITCVNCLEIIDMLEKNEKTCQCDILSLEYMIKTIEEDYAMSRKIPDQLRLSDIQYIPKMIHYCWFGGKPIPDQNRRWIDSWHQFCPDYEIVEWNEGNYDITKNRYMYEAYKQKKWGFVPDYARLDIIYNYGGIYLDTDVELIKSMDDLLYQKGFAGFESKDYVALGLGFGAVRHLPIIKKMMDDYEQREFINQDGSENLVASPSLQTKVLEKEGLNKDGEYQIVDDLTIFPEKMLSGKSYSTMRVKLTPYTHAIHHYNASWHSEKEYFDNINKIKIFMNRFEGK